MAGSEGRVAKAFLHKSLECEEEGEEGDVEEEKGNVEFQHLH